jgi:hypothetical protein
VELILGFLVKPDGKTPMRRNICTWKNNNKMDLREIAWGIINRIDLVLNRDRWRALVNMVMNLRIP